MQKLQYEIKLNGPQLSIQNVTVYSQLVARLVGELRKRHGIDQGAFAERLGVSQSTWSRAENGQVGLSLDQLAGAAQILDTSPSQVLSQADAAAVQLARRGVTVLRGKEAAKDDQTFAYLGAAALGALIAAVLAKGK